MQLAMLFSSKGECLGIQPLSVKVVTEKYSGENDCLLYEIVLGESDAGRACAITSTPKDSERHLLTISAMHSDGLVILTGSFSPWRESWHHFSEPGET